MDKLLGQVGQCACVKQPAAAAHTKTQHLRTHTYTARTYTPHTHAHEHTWTRKHTHTPHMNIHGRAHTHTPQRKHTHMRWNIHTRTHTHTARQDKGSDTCAQVRCYVFKLNGSAINTLTQVKVVSYLRIRTNSSIHTKCCLRYYQRMSNMRRTGTLW